MRYQKPDISRYNFEKLVEGRNGLLFAMQDQVWVIMSRARFKVQKNERSIVARKAYNKHTVIIILTHSNDLIGLEVTSLTKTHNDLIAKSEKLYMGAEKCIKYLRERFLPHDTPDNIDIIHSKVA